MSAYREQHGDGALNDLLNYGLLIREGERYRMAGEVFAEWIRERVEMESARPDAKRVEGADREWG